MKKRVLSLLLALCLLIGLFPVLPAFAADAPDKLYLEPSAASNIPSRIELYPDPSGEANLYHMYLPGNAVAGSCFLSWEGGASASLGGRSYASGTLPIPAPGETETVSFGSKKFIIRTYQGSPGVKPIFIEIDESQGTIAAMNADPNHNTTCTGEIVIDGERMGLPQIKGRGNATWRDDKEKKPYNIKLDSKVNLLGIDCDKTKKWSLLSNVNDRTLLRNKVAYDLAHQMGIGFDSASVDLWMNGVYWGTYLLTPKTDSFITDDGYLIEDNNISDNDEPHIDGTGMILNIKEIGKNLLLAEGENIEDSATIRAAASKISSYFKEAWNAVSADNGKNSKGKHYSEYFDMDSMAAFYLLHEFIKNLEVDGGSIFIHRDGTSDTDKLIAGPAWDYDNSMGYNGQQTMAAGGSGWPSDARSTNYASLSIGNWYITGRNRGKLFGTFSKHQDFLDLTHEVYNRYYKLFDDISANVRRQAALIADSAEMNFVRTVKEDKNNFDFPDERVNGKYYGQLQFDAGTPYEVNYKAPEVWPDYVDNLVTYTTGRARFFRDQMYVENTCEHDYKAVVTAPTCTEKGFTTYTCSKCGDSYVDQEVPALGHNFVNGVCIRCGQAAMKATFVCDEGVSVTVYDKQDLTGAHENATDAFPRDSGTGEIDVSGSGQVNFVVNVAPGYQFESITAEPKASYKNFKLPEETMVPNGYRITKMTGNVTVTVKAVKNECQHNYKAVETPATCTAQGYTTYTCTKCGDSYVSDYTPKIDHNYVGGVCTVCGEKLLNVTISCGAGASVTVYETQKADGPGTANATQANPRDGDSGLIDCSGEGQVNFQVVLADGYELESVTAEPTSAYKNLKGPSDTGMENGYRVTKVTGDFTVTVTTRRSGEVPATPTARFVCDEGVSITTYQTQNQQGAQENATEAFARNSMTGEPDASGEGQVNFVVNVAEGYKLESVTAEPKANYKNFKLPEETLVNNGYRITKMTGDVTVTVKASKVDPGSCEHNYVPTVTPPTCTAQGYTTYECSICHDSYVSDYTAKNAHNYVGGVCTVCGEKLLNVTISCSEGASVTVFETQKADGPSTANATKANPRDGDSGLIDCSGEGQVNFQVVLDRGYALESVTAEPTASYKNLKGPADTGMENGYRVTKVKGDFSITVKAVPTACEHDYVAVVTPPTCTEKGYTTYTCSICGDSYVEDEVDELLHDWPKEGVVTRQATQTQRGVLTFTCARCGATKTRPIAAGNEAAHKDEILFISDLHSGKKAEEGNHNLRAMFRLLRENDGFVPEVVCGGGDYLESRTYDDVDWPHCFEVLRDVMYNDSPDTAQALTSGNHDWEWSRQSEEMIEKLLGVPRVGNNYSGEDFEIFQIGAQSNDSDPEEFLEADIETLRAFLASRADSGKVIFIQTHYPLHYGYNSDEWRTTKNADKLIDLLNEYADRLDIVFVWGHNHNEDEMRHTCLVAGDELQYTKKDSKEIRFTYVNAGCLNERHADEDAGPSGSYYGPGYLLEARIAGDKLILDYGHITDAYPDPAEAKYDHNADLLYVDEIQEARQSHYEIQLLHRGVCTHDYQAVVTAPTCTEAGYTTYTCSKCGDSYVDNEVPALGHDYKGAVTAPTCTEAGYTTYTCSRCGDSYTGNAVAALGHNYRAVVTAPTCTATGYTTHTCSRCGDSYTDTATAALGHDWGEGVVTVAPTETSTGLRTYTCARCNEKRTEVIPELSHVHSYTALVVAPTCTERGYTLHTCACGDSYQDSYTNALGHSFGSWTVTRAATCTVAGEEARTCARCGEKETRQLQAAGHDYNSVVTAPTCTEAGYTTYNCAKCGDSYTGDATAALGHSFGDWTVTVAATCTGKGAEARTCTRCDAAETREIDALGHDLAGHEAKAPTCTEPGWAAYQTCSRCDYTTYAEQPALGHDYVDGVCTRCGAADPDYQPPINRAALQAAIAAAEALDLSKYTDESVAALNKALTDARAALEADTQAAVDKAAAGLDAAVKALAPKPAFRFDDVKDESQYFFEPVYWAVDRGITTGTSPTTFSPNNGCTRAQVVTFLWRAAGKPAPGSSANPFEDVKAGQYYYDAVLWAVEQGITQGTGPTTFRPDATCTRAQIVTFLWRYLGKPAPGSSKNPFTDVKTGEYYYDAVLWAVEKGITKGTSADKFSPNATCTRAQIVTFLYRATEA